MPLFKKTQTFTPSSKKFKKIDKCSDQELILWANNLTLYIGSAFDQWRYHDAPLDEAIQTVSLLLEVLEELKSRGVKA